MGDSLNDKKYNSIEKEETTYDKTKNFVRLAGGVYKATEPTYSDGDVAHLLFNSKGHLKVDTELSLTGDVYVDNVKTFATNISDPTTQTYGLVDATGHVATNVAKIAGTATDVNSGNKSNGTQRVTIATDDIPIALINTNLGTINTNLADVVDTSAHLVRIAEQDPIFNNFTPEVICDITNGTDGTYNFYTTGDTFNEVGTQLLIDGGSGTATVTVEATAQDDGTAPESCVYVDVTNAMFGAANFTASNYLFDTNKVLGQAKWIKYKVVLDTTGANDADVKIMIKKKW